MAFLRESLGIADIPDPVEVKAVIVGGDRDLEQGFSGDHKYYGSAGFEEEDFSVSGRRLL